MDIGVVYGCVGTQIHKSGSICVLFSPNFVLLCYRSLLQKKPMKETILSSICVQDTTCVCLVVCFFGGGGQDRAGYKTHM